MNDTVASRSSLPRVELAYRILSGDDSDERVCRAIPEAACTNLPRNYVLNVANGAATKLNTPRIALKRGPIKLEYYANAAWTDVAPQLVQTLIVESFENTGKIVSVGREHAALRSDYLLKTELREFQAHYRGAGPPEAVVQINAKLVKMPQRTIIAGENFGARMPAATDTLPAVVEAFDEALGKTLRKLVEWTMRAPARVD